MTETGMNKSIVMLHELTEKTGISVTDAREWGRFGLLAPSGFSDERVPFYEGEALEKALEIKKLVELGYGLKEIRKIVKKIRLPGQNEKGDRSERKSRLLTVGVLAEKSDVSPRTLKHWEDKGIIEPDMRSEGGFRLYDASSIELCLLIKDLQLFGFTLDEIKIMADHLRAYLAVQNGGESVSLNDASRKLEAMLGDIRMIRERMELLRKGVKRWNSLLKKNEKKIVEIRRRAAKRTNREKRKERT